MGPEKNTKMSTPLPLEERCASFCLSSLCINKTLESGRE